MRFARKLETARLLLRQPHPDDAEALNHAVVVSFDELHKWVPWAIECPTVEQTRAYCLESRILLEKEERYDLLITRQSDGTILGACGYPRLDWTVPKFEIGYWCRSDHTSRGYASEATYELTRYAFQDLEAARVELHIDHRNAASIRIARKLGFPCEGLHRSDFRDPDGELRDTRVYAATSLEQISAPIPGSQQDGKRPRLR